MTKTLNDTEARAVINGAAIGHLGCVNQGEPYVVPINYVAEEGAIYSHSLPGKKIDAMRLQPRVCLQVDQIVDDFHWRSAIAFGNFEEIRVPTDRRAILGKLLARFPLLTTVESTMAKDAGAPDSIVFCIRVDRVTGVVEE